MSEESRPAVIRSMLSRGARPVGSMTYQAPLMWASATAWKSMGLSPGAYTAASRAGTFLARSSEIARWAKSRQTPRRCSRVSTAPSVPREDPLM